MAEIIQTCGCSALWLKDKPLETTIQYCSLHEAAPVTYEVLKEVAPYVGHYHERLARIVGDAYGQNPTEGLLEALGFFKNLEKSKELRKKVADAIALAEGERTPKQAAQDLVDWYAQGGLDISALADKEVNDEQI